MAVELAERMISVDDYVAINDARLEIMDGEFVQMSAAGISHQIFASNIYNHIYEYLKTNPLGLLLADATTFLMFSDKQRLRDAFLPDVAFIRSENFLPMDDLSKPYPGVPDLAVEVVSPDDKPDYVMRKIRAYLEKGTAQVWIIYPTAREVHQYRRDTPDTARLYTGSQVIEADPLLPDFRLPLDVVFHMPEWLKPKFQSDTPEE